MDLKGFALLLLIIVANGAPILGAAVLRSRGRYPLDAGLRWFDGRRLLGPSKTWRGIALAIVAPCLMTWLMAMPVSIGLAIGVFAMLGDLLSSFIKRRLGFLPSSRALGLDQIPESLLPLLAVRDSLDLDWPTIFETIAAFFVLELVLSRILYHLRVRRQPY
jgi:CDP-2,3-bis-(O-geranylgeranyl)-sn-glycerol synthase